MNLSTAQFHYEKIEYSFEAYMIYVCGRYGAPYHSFGTEECFGFSSRFFLHNDYYYLAGSWYYRLNKTAITANSKLNAKLNVWQWRKSSSIGRLQPTKQDAKDKWKAFLVRPKFFSFSSICCFFVVVCLYVVLFILCEYSSWWLQLWGLFKSNARSMNG